MQYIRELWLWLGEHQTAAIVVMVLVALIVTVAIIWQYDLIGALRRLGELVQ